MRPVTESILTGATRSPWALNLIAGAFEEALPWADRKPPVHVGSPVSHSLSGAPAVCLCSRK